MNKTQIEWVKNPDGTQGYTWNPITGCLNGCEYCYARKLANTRLRERYLANTNVSRQYLVTPTSKTDAQVRRDGEAAFANPFYPRFWEERVLEPWDQYARYRPKGIFVCDMSDLFGIGVPEKWTQDVLHTIRNSKGHRFYLLTKQPQNLIKWSPFPENAWVGQSITQALDGIGYMAEVEAAVKFISFEPLLYYGVDPLTASELFRISGINWVIIGAQTKPYKPPKIEWVREIIEAADKAGIPVFLKNNLKPLIAEPGVVEVDEFELRQEMPK